MTEPRFVDELPKNTGKKVTIACIDGRSTHLYGPDGLCKFCGYERPYPEKKTSTVGSSSRSTESTRPVGTSFTGTGASRVSRLEPAFTKKEAHDGIAMILAVGQQLLIARAPKLKEDALNARERALLADALAEEATQSTTLHRWLAKVGKQKKHAKLGMVLTAILLPRLARHGIIPNEGITEVQGELLDQLETGATPGFGRGSSTGSEPSWDTVPVAAGGSPFVDRRNGQREVDFSGVAPETAPLRDHPSNEAGRDSVASSGGGQESSRDEEPPVRPDRAPAGSKAHRPEAS